MVEITASYPAGVIGTTLENLQEAAAGAHEEWSLDYPKFADIADEALSAAAVPTQRPCPYSCCSQTRFPCADGSRWQAIPVSAGQ